MENYALVSEKEIEEMKERILKGEFLNKNYLAQYDPVDCSSTLKRFCLYKSDAEKSWRGEDCDVSLAAVVTYSMMYDWLDGNTIQWQPGSCVKYCVMGKQGKEGKGNLYYGDTMTSAWTVLRKYLFCLWEKEPQNSNLRGYFFSNGQELTTYSKNDPYKGFTDYFFKLLIRNKDVLDVLEEKVCVVAKEFLDNYLKAGNMIATPEKFNVPRSNNGRWDTVDRMLWKIYQYFKNGKDKAFLFQMFTEEKDAAVTNCLNWFKDAGIDKWEDFVEENLMMPFVDKDLRPISLKTGKAIELGIREDYKPMPTSIEECEVFFETANKGIEERSRLIWEKIQGASQ